jgi:hypothetical protein
MASASVRREREEAAAAACCAQRDAAAQREKDAAAQRERDAAAQREKDAAAQREKDAAAQRERDAAAQLLSERDAAAQRERDAAAQRERDAAAQRERDAAAQRERDAAAQRERDAAGCRSRRPPSARRRSASVASARRSRFARRRRLRPRSGAWRGEEARARGGEEARARAGAAWSANVRRPRRRRCALERENLARERERIASRGACACGARGARGGWTARRRRSVRASPPSWRPRSARCWRAASACVARRRSSRRRRSDWRSRTRSSARRQAAREAARLAAEARASGASSAVPPRSVRARSASARSASARSASVGSRLQEKEARERRERIERARAEEEAERLRIQREKAALAAEREALERTAAATVVSSRAVGSSQPVGDAHDDGDGRGVVVQGRHVGPRRAAGRPRLVQAKQRNSTSTTTTTTSSTSGDSYHVSSDIDFGETLAKSDSSKIASARAYELRRRRPAVPQMRTSRRWDLPSGAYAAAQASQPDRAAVCAVVAHARERGGRRRSPRDSDRSGARRAWACCVDLRTDPQYFIDLIERFRLPFFDGDAMLLTSPVDGSRMRFITAEGRAAAEDAIRELRRIASGLPLTEPKLSAGMTLAAKQGLAGELVVWLHSAVWSLRGQGGRVLRVRSAHGRGHCAAAADRRRRRLAHEAQDAARSTVSARGRGGRRSAMLDQSGVSIH